MTGVRSLLFFATATFLGCAHGGGAMNNSSRPATFELAGEIRDARTHQVVSGALVVIATDTGHVVRTQSDLTGRFSVSLLNGAPHTNGYFINWKRENDAANKVSVRVREGQRCARAEYPPHIAVRASVLLLIATCDQKELEDYPR